MVRQKYPTSWKLLDWQKYSEETEVIMHKYIQSKMCLQLYSEMSFFNMQSFKDINQLIVSHWEDWIFR